VAGTTGPVGPQGSPGAVGPAGPIGPTGPAGLQGLPGAPGAPGAVGPSGPTGPVGSAGKDGITGPIGAVGAVGPAGPAGLAGPAGSTGLPGSASGPSMYVSGSRIKASFFDTPDGAHGFSTWYDSTLAVPCMPFPASDDVTRCMPTRQMSWADGNNEGWYLTVTCDGNPVIDLRTGTSTTPYATFVNSLGEKLVRKIGAQVPTGTVLYYGSAITSCFVKGPPTAQDTFFSTGVVLDAATFTGMTESVE